MFYRIKLQKIILVISFGLLMSVGTYFFIPPAEKAFSCKVRISKFAGWSGALIGAYSQLILDSIMHRDMSPFFPFSDYNGLQRVISIGTLHDLCTGLFVLGILIFVFRKLVIRT